MNSRVHYQLASLPTRKAMHLKLDFRKPVDLNLGLKVNWAYLQVGLSTTNVLWSDEVGVKARPNARNISTQHLATSLDRVVRCCEGADQTRATSCNVHSRMLQH